MLLKCFCSFTKKNKSESKIEFPLNNWDLIFAPNRPALGSIVEFSLRKSPRLRVTSLCHKNLLFSGKQPVCLYSNSLARKHLLFLETRLSQRLPALSSPTCSASHQFGIYCRGYFCPIWFLSRTAVVPWLPTGRVRTLGTLL